MKKNGKVLSYIRYIVTAVCIIVIGVLTYCMFVNPKTANTDSKKNSGAQKTQVSSEDKYDSSTGPDETDKNEDIVTDTETADSDKMAESTTLIFAGDLIYGSTFCTNYDKEGMTGVVSEELLAEMNAADITMVNEEFPFSTRGIPMEDKQYTFRADPSYVESFREMGIDIVALANNHTLDYGKDALYDTFTTLEEAGILYAGAGDSVERAAKLQIIEVNGKKFGFLAASRVLPVVEWNVENSVPGALSTYDKTRLVQAIEEADSQCDVLTVYVHWGVEMQEHPEDYQRNLAAAYIEAGADAVIGSHPHVLQGVEYIEGKPVFYSLGNFISTPYKDKTMLVKLTVDEENEITAQIIPATTENGQTRKRNELEQQLLNDYIESISYGVTIDGNGIIGQ